VTSPLSIDVREVIFINERCRRDYYSLPEAVGEAADQAIDALQNGRQLPPKMFKQLSGKLAGIDEIRIPYDDDTYRVYVVQECKWYHGSRRRDEEVDHRQEYPEGPAGTLGRATIENSSTRKAERRRA